MGKKKKKSKEPPPIDHPSFVDAAQVVELKKAWDNFSFAKEGAHGLHIMTGNKLQDALSECAMRTLTNLEMKELENKFGVQYAFKLTELKAEKEFKYAEFANMADFVDGMEFWEKSIDAAFGVYDVNGDGKIDKAELTAILTGGMGAAAVTPADVEQLLAKLDTDHNGSIDKAEFIQYIKPAPQDLKKKKKKKKK